VRTDDETLPSGPRESTRPTDVRSKTRSIALLLQTGRTDMMSGLTGTDGEVWKALTCLVVPCTVYVSLQIYGNDKDGETSMVDLQNGAIKMKTCIQDMYVCNLSRRRITLLPSISVTMKFILQTRFSKSLPNYFLSIFLIFMRPCIVI
jgi:hypothetical protein